MTPQELSDKTHNGMMNAALGSVAALFERDGWSPCDALKAANELLEPAFDAWNVLMTRVESDADRLAALERELAEARKPCPCKVRDAAIDAAIDAAMGGE
jgi:hypothetical protein